ncbi:Re/Si-specific NAD(P)(+) transhydrogenase subunit alpha [Streptomyces sp. NPDC088674]|uniref:Re/Si-specific NAD(P)(+) transhydrogenase subunit alpha n=1 Tax=Streptomyces sp. NPDC088674 TaxID=3365869 RepID=UPI0037F96193
MLIGVVREDVAGEARVAATPESVARLRELGYEVVVEPGAGEHAGFPDAAYAEAGARTGAARGADVVLAVRTPPLDGLRAGATLVGLLDPAHEPERLAELARRGITALAMEAVPRISRAQSLDVLSSTANIAGYRAVVEAAHALGRLFGGQVTAAGKTPPATVLVAGAGVAGLAAIGTAGALGAVVRATDPRPEVAEQVRSLGGEYLPVAPPGEEGAGTGYAREMGAEYRAREAELYARECAGADVVITTALVPGRPAPRLLTAETVAAMKPGSVIVDMAAASGGNVAGTVPGERVVTPGGVVILGYTDLAGRLPGQASRLYANNLVALLTLLTPDRDGTLVLDTDDIVQRSIAVVRAGEVHWPPPPVPVSATSAPPAEAERTAPAEAAPAPPPRRGRRYALAALAAALLLLGGATAPPAFLGHLTVFALAVVIGFYVIGNVHHALHTPLMSVTNAISGIVVVGALLQIGHGDTAVTVLAALAILLACVNIFGGFAVTRRMLGMFFGSGS